MMRFMKMKMKSKMKARKKKMPRAPSLHLHHLSSCFQLPLSYFFVFGVPMPRGRSE
jgi:hypothetical protein